VGMRCFQMNAAGTVISDNAYFYATNAQGDVIAIYSNTGTKLYTYTYDAWGNLIEGREVAAGGAAIGALNPLRYRGYYFDAETGLYYLNSRYYNPQWGRFLNADDATVITATPGALTDKNLYIYCDNNPVMRADEDGEFWNVIVGAVVGAVAGGLIAALNGEDTAGIVIGALSGAASGAVAATGLGWVAQAGISAAISATADMANQTIDIVQSGGTISDYDVFQTVTEAGLGFATSAAGSALGKFAGKKVTKTAVKADQLYDRYLGKTFTAGLRKEAGKSSTALLRQANNFLTQSNFFQNVSNGVSSVIGSGISFWNIAR